ncbi:MAG: (2Fe-2S)-binding protein, partial [Pseudomonadota bacterium]
DAPEIAALPGIGYWARAVTETGWRTELASDVLPICWESHARLLFGAAPDAPAVSAIDKATGRAAVAVSQDGKTLGVLYANRTPVAVARSHVVAELTTLPAADLLAGRPALDQPDSGALVCACMGVGANTITDAVAAHGLATIDSIGEATGAGTSCGSCRPELSGFLLPPPAQVAAE